MSNYAIMRLKKRKGATVAAMARHMTRESNPANADPSRRKANDCYGPRTADGIVAAIEARLPAKRRKDAVTAIEFFVGASPEAMQEMTREQQRSFFRRALDWIAERFGGRDNIVAAVVHNDETTPHMQVLTVPLVDGKLNAKRLVGDRDKMQSLQTSFATEVGGPAGLRRGERGSGAKHTSIRQFYGAIEAAGSVDAIPEAKPVPPPLEKPGRFAGQAVRDAYEKRERERRGAMESNKKRQAWIERMARAGLVVQGRKRLPRALARAEDLERRNADAERQTRLQEAQVNELRDQVGRLNGSRQRLIEQQRTAQSTPTETDRQRQR